MERKDLKKYTTAFIWIILSIIVVYDAVVAIIGYGSTISNLTTAWSFKYPIFPMVYGCLASHFFFPSNVVSNLRYIMAFSIGGILSVVGYFAIKSGAALALFIFHPFTVFIMGVALVIILFTKRKI